MEPTLLDAFRIAKDELILALQAAVSVFRVPEEHLLQQPARRATVRLTLQGLQQDITAVENEFEAIGEAPRRILSPFHKKCNRSIPDIAGCLHARCCGGAK